MKDAQIGDGDLLRGPETPEKEGIWPLDARPGRRQTLVGKALAWPFDVCHWLFAGNDQAAEHHARLWSLVASCERYGIDPQRYLTSVLAKIGTTPTAELEQFLPDVWKRDDAADSLVDAD